MSDDEDGRRARLRTLDVVSLTFVEVYAVLTHLSHNPNPVVTEALVDAVRRVLVTDAHVSVRVDCSPVR